MVKRALVLDAGSAAGVETVQALGRAGIEVDVADVQPTSLAFRSRYPRRRVRQPSPASVPTFLAWLDGLDAARRYTLIVPSTEASLVALRQRPAFDPRRVKAVLASDDALDVALDKRRTVELASRLGIPVPESRMIASLEEADASDECPVVLKPVRSAAAVGNDVVILQTAIARDERARRAALAALLTHGPVQQQRYVGGRGIGVEMLFDRGRAVWYFAHERIHETPLTGGGSTYRRSIVPPPDLLDAAAALLRALEWHGVAMVEFKVAGDGSFYLMEVNPRLWGSLALAIDCGVNFPLGLWRIAAGQSHDPQPSYCVPYFTRHLAKDVEWQRENWRADHDDRLLLTRPRARALAECARPLLGVESWDHWDVKDLGVTVTMLVRFVSLYARGYTAGLGRRLLTRRIARLHAKRFGSEPSGRRVERLLFVCHGNICRSPFAEGLARVALPECAVDSVGARAMPDGRSPERLTRIARSMGVDLADRCSARITASHVAWADLILVMDTDNWRMVAAEFPEAVTKMTLLGLFAGDGRAVIADPYAKSEDVMYQSLEQIRGAVNGLSRWLRAQAEPSGPAAGSDLPAAMEAAVANRLPAPVRAGASVPTHRLEGAERDDSCAG